MHYYKLYINFGGTNKNGYGVKFQSEKDMNDEEDIIAEAIETNNLSSEDEEWVETAEQIDEENFNS